MKFTTQKANPNIRLEKKGIDSLKRKVLKRITTRGKKGMEGIKKNNCILGEEQVEQTTRYGMLNQTRSRLEKESFEIS